MSRRCEGRSPADRSQRRAVCDLLASTPRCLPVWITALTRVASSSGSGRRISPHLESQEVVDLLTKAKDFSLVLEDRPGTLAKVATAMSRANINIDGFSGASECGNTFHLLFIRDADRARSALESAGYRVKAERDVALVDVEARPGAPSAEVDECAEQEFNVDVVLLTADDHPVVRGQVEQV